VVDADGRVRRRNQVAFREEGDINTTVSREHARTTWDDATGGYWLRAEQNASGTRIIRAGKTIDVSAHDRRGVRLQAGDEIYLGQACVKVGMRTDLADRRLAGEP
jgi:predicted component of type VI protein secretion system